MTKQKQVHHFERDFSMPDKRTFKMKPVKRLFEEENADNTWLDLFPYPYERDALDYLCGLKGNSINGIKFDPPYSDFQLMNTYDNKGNSLSPSNTTYYKKLRNECFRVLKPNHKVITFGWNSVLFPGFRMDRIMMLNHGGMHNDTIITVQRKIQEVLFV